MSANLSQRIRISIGFAVFVFGLAVMNGAFAQWQPTVLWDRSGDMPTSHFGTSVFPLGDQNNDGFDDWGVFSSGQASDNYAGIAVQFFHGGNPPSQQPYLTFRRDPGMNRYRGSSCGDLNGDGYMDWYIELRYDAQPESLQVRVFYGGPGADTIPDVVFWFPFGESASFIDPYGHARGYRVNFNGDAYDDLALLWNDNSVPLRYISFYYGGSTMDGQSDWVAHNILSEAYGDVNGDHITDFVALSPSTIHIYFGSSQPDSTDDIILTDVTCADPTLVDLNGDGRADLIDPKTPGGQVYLGGDQMSNLPDFQLNFGCGSGPHNVSGIGDINHDGFQDVVISDPACGRLALYLGYFWVNGDPVWAEEDLQPPLYLMGIHGGHPVGDINNDGIDDWAIGATSDEAGGVPGRVVILAGDASLRVGANDPVILPPSSFILSVFPNPFNAETTISFSLTRESRVSIQVFDILGRNAGALLWAPTSIVQAGEHQIMFDGAGLASGIYFVRVSTGTDVKIQKMVMVK